MAFARYRVCKAVEYIPEIFLLCDFRHSRGDALKAAAVLIASIHSVTNSLGKGLVANSVQKTIDRAVDDTLNGVESGDLRYMVKLNRVAHRPSAPASSPIPPASHY